MRSQYAFSSTSASKRASFPKGLGSNFVKPILSCSVAKERDVLRIIHKSSSRRTLTERRASGASFVGRISERTTSAERPER